MQTVTKQDVKKLFPAKDKWSHKGSAGKLLIVGGSVRYSGSPAFAALSAIRSGTDLTLVAAPKRAADIIACFQPDIIAEPLSHDYIRPSDVKHILKMTEWASATVIGGGIDRKPKTYMAINSIILKNKKPCVIDAEAIRAVAMKKRTLNNTHVITPHENEFQALGGEKPSYNIKKRANQVMTLANKIGATILLKGNIDVVSDGIHVKINKTGNPYMTKGGTGDTLAGVCGSLLSRGVKPFESACAAAWINGAAGDAVLKKIGPGFFVSEMVDFIPEVVWK